jgi:hypothetical protein
MRPELPEMKGQQREQLLKELYRLVVTKRVVDEVTSSNRTKALGECSIYRPYRIWLAAVSMKLENVIKAMKKVVDVANKQPPRTQPRSIEPDGVKTVVNKTIRSLSGAGNRLARVAEDIGYYQFVLSAVIHPRLRTKAEKRLVHREPRGLKHGLVVPEKTRKIDLTFDRTAASILHRYRTKADKPIPRDKTISRLLFVAFDITKPEDTIRRDLSRHRAGRNSRTF